MTYSTHFNTFTVEREVAAPISLAWFAFSTREGKSAWFAPPASWTVLEDQFDFREGGVERLKGLWENGKISDFQCRYHNIVPESRIIYSYDMFVDEKRISVSLATIEFLSAPKGTLIRITEQLVHVDGYPTPEDRIEGTRYLIEKAAAAIEAQAANQAAKEGTLS